MSEQRHKTKITFPTIQARSSLASSKEEFIPVIKLRRYNLLKIKELCNHREKDKRLGRAQSHHESIGSLLQAQAIQRQRQQHYMVGRKVKYEKMKNHSYLSLMEKMRQDYRHCTLQK